MPARKRKWPKPATSHRGEGTPTVILSSHDEGQSVADEISTQVEKMKDAQIKYMVDRFLGWRLPEDFHPDAGISFDPTFNKHLPTPTKHNPTGTNLFHAQQAEAMIRYMVEGLPPSPQKPR